MLPFVSAPHLEILARHVPQLRYHPLEPYRADSAALLTDSFLESAYSNALCTRENGRVLARSRPIGSGAALSLELLGPVGEPYYPGGPLAAAEHFLQAHEPTLQQDAQRMRRLPGYA